MLKNFLPKMKRITRNSAKKAMTISNKKKEVEAEVDKKIKKEPEQLLEEKIKKEVKSEAEEDFTGYPPSPSKLNLDEFRARPKNLPKLPTSSPRKTKREHVAVEYEEISASKIKREILREGGKPPSWEEVLENMREMRKECDAPVDSMGCHKCMDDEANPKDMRYQALLSLMLSSQTKDQVTHAAMLKLRQHGCTLENILNTSDEKLGELIYPVGFWKSKVKYIKKTSEMLRDQFDGDIPRSVKDLCKLSGVGPKMAHLCMQIAWNEVTGIGVDTHVHRISNRLGWVETKTPEKTQEALEAWLPKELWSEVNHLLVGFGQQICLPINPQCATCLNYKLCPFGIKQLYGPNKKTKK